MTTFQTLRVRQWPVRKKVLAGFLTAGVTLVAAGCAFVWRPTSVPLRYIVASAGCPVRPDTLLVLLPGSWSVPEDFEREGVVAAARQRHLAVDLWLVDAHVGYYRERSIVDRLAADIVEPARARGYRHVWIGGISIGAFGALLYAQDHPGDVEGVIAIAPYFGSPQIARTVDAAGGLAAWKPPGGSAAAGDLDTPFWEGLREQFVDVADSTTSAPTPSTPTPRKPRKPPKPPKPPKPLYLGYGLADRFVASDDVLARALPSSRVFTAEGGHDWPVWNALWPRMLAALPFPPDPTCGKP